MRAEARDLSQLISKIFGHELMGNWNSGRNNRGAGRCESWHRIEITYLRKNGFMIPGRSSILSWTCRGEQTGSIGIRAFGDHAELRYRCNGENIVQHINYRHTPTNFGGWRQWFECPNCYRTCGTLYGGRRFYCRECWQLTYSSQYEQPFERARSQASKIRAKVGQKTSTPDQEPFPEKPKRMHWDTYYRLRARDSLLVRDYEDGFCQKAMALPGRRG
jgi:hypothetical protein